MNQPNLLALYGLKFNPFAQDIPVEAVFVPPKLDHFCWRIENGMAREGGFAMVHGDPGCGKSVTLRLLHQRLMRVPDLMVGSIAHPQSNLADFYRELSDIFTVPLKPHNRWGGFKALRERWLTHMEASRRRCVLLIDEAQEMAVPALPATVPCAPARSCEAQVASKNIPRQTAPTRQQLPRGGPIGRATTPLLQLERLWRCGG